MTQLPERFYADSEDIMKIVRDVKKEFLEANPGYKLFDSEIGSYLVRAIERRNETGISRPVDFKKDIAAQGAYMGELKKIAFAEVENCMERFKDRIPPKPKKKKDEDKLSYGKTLDDYDFLSIKLS